MNINTFTDKRMKILDMLTFMCRGMAQVWAANETNAVLANMSMFNTLAELLAAIERTFGDPDHERMAHNLLHVLKMTAGMTADEYTANFEMLTWRTSFNEATMEDAYIQGLPQSILQKVYSQTSLPSGMDNWKMVVHNLNHLQRGFTELKQSIHLSQSPFPQMQTPIVTQMMDTLVPMDIDKSKCRLETGT